MKKSKTPVIGILLILFGAMLLLDRLDVIYFGWGRIFWMFVGIYGAVIAVEGFSRKKQGRVFWGSLLFFAGVFYSLEAFDLVWWMDYYWVAAASLALGLAFFMLFVFEPRNFGVLVPTLLFGGFGAMVYLAEHKYLDWWEVRHYIRDYWPLLLILWGLAIVFKRRPQTTS